GLLERDAERLGDDAANRVAAAAGAERVNEGDRLARIVVGAQRRAEQCRPCGHENETKLFHAWFLSGYREFSFADASVSRRRALSICANEHSTPTHPLCPDGRRKDEHPAHSLRRHDAEVLGRAANPRALLRDISSEVGRPAEIGDLPGEVQPFLDRRINGLANVCGDAFANSLGHGRRAEKADKAGGTMFWLATLRERGS